VPERSWNGCVPASAHAIKTVNGFCHSCSPNRYKTPVEFHFERRIRLVPVTEAEQR